MRSYTLPFNAVKIPISNQLKKKKIFFIEGELRMLKITSPQNIILFLMLKIKHEVGTQKLHAVRTYNFK